MLWIGPEKADGASSSTAGSRRSVCKRRSEFSAAAMIQCCELRRWWRLADGGHLVPGEPNRYWLTWHAADDGHAPLLR